MTRSVRDAAILLSVIAGKDQLDPATRDANIAQDYSAFLDPNGLKGARIGVPRAVYWAGLSPKQAQIVENAIGCIRDCGATVIDPAEIATAKETETSHFEVLLYDFKHDINRYFKALGSNAPIKSLKELIAYNEQRPEKMLRYGQLILQAAQSTSGKLEEAIYAYRRAEDLRLSQHLGIDATIKQHRLDALLFPIYSGYGIAARPGYPSVIVPAGYTADNTPVGVTFTARAWQEPRLIRLAYAFEQASQARRPPALTPAL
jgi:amidase